MNKRILVVNDDLLLARTIDMCLTRRGHEVQVFHNGIDAVEYLMEQTPHSLVLDIGLPDCDGWFIARLLGRLEGKRNVQLIVVSDLERDPKRIAEIKPYTYIHKPFDMRQLIQAVEESATSVAPAASGQGRADTENGR